jgi:hypothetical protein
MCAGTTPLKLSGFTTAVLTTKFTSSSSDKSSSLLVAQIFDKGASTPMASTTCTKVVGSIPRLLQLVVVASRHV